jgi:hypothetical protein
VSCEGACACVGMTSPPGFWFRVGTVLHLSVHLLCSWLPRQCHQAEPLPRQDPWRAPPGTLGQSAYCQRFLQQAECMKRPPIRQVLAPNLTKKLVAEWSRTLRDGLHLRQLCAARESSAAVCSSLVPRRKTECPGYMTSQSHELSTSL